jgi:dihydropteroate synthase
MQDRTTQIQSLIAAAQDATRPPLVMGVLNVTPDSFSDGGRHLDVDDAVAAGVEMAALGADLIDIGGESTRPMAAPVSALDELERVLPVVRLLATRIPTPLSVDTRSAAVAAAALDAGAVVINDVSGFVHDPAMPELLGRLRPIAIAMHMRGTPADMQLRTGYRSLLAECVGELWRNASRALDAGLPLDHLWLDPGIGFSKTWDQNLQLLADLDLFVALGRPVLAGVSRKSFIGRVLDRPSPADRLFGTAAAVALAVNSGARIVRVHDVAPMRDVVRMAHAIARAVSR